VYRYFDTKIIYIVQPYFYIPETQTELCCHINKVKGRLTYEFSNSTEGPGVAGRVGVEKLWTKLK
jgi:hypothetical protein